MIGAPLLITARIADVLQRLRVSYAVGGSLASSLHGVPRATHDVDIVADLRPAHIEPFVRALEGNFYLDAAMIQGALLAHEAFNILDRDTMLKVDIL